MGRRILTCFCAFLFASALGAQAAQTLTPQEAGWLEKASRVEKNGWIFLHLEGEPFEIGFQRGYLTAAEIDECKRATIYVTKFDTAKDWDFFLDAATRLFKGTLSDEYVLEMKGMAAGMTKAGKPATYEDILLLNGSTDLMGYWWPEQKKEPAKPAMGCSAFIATGSATAGGRIVMAHNTWSSYVDGRFCNIIVDILPQNGQRMLMQTWGPSIYSTSDFFITGAGLVGTETTISGFSGFDETGIPVFERSRKAMQYAGSIDEWIRIMVEKNNGAYANSWLIGDTRTGEIARLELGLKHHSVEKKRDGYFTGSNVTDDIAIRVDETDHPYDDTRSFAVARRERWKQLMKLHYGKIDVEAAKRMLADHYDIYLEKEIPTSRTICGHEDLDDGMVPGSGPPYSPSGAYDGKVVDSEMAKQWRIWARWGHSCDISFDAKQFVEKHTQYDYLDGYLKDLPATPWTVFPPDRK
ncbi:MAG: C45 family peptidase [Acidobacteriota bacterium]